MAQGYFGRAPAASCRKKIPVSVLTGIAEFSSNPAV
jgi:hypothetical protein